MRIHYPKLHNITHAPSFNAFIAFKGTKFLYFYLVHFIFLFGTGLVDVHTWYVCPDLNVLRIFLTYSITASYSVTAWTWADIKSRIIPLCFCTVFWISNVLSFTWDSILTWSLSFHARWYSKNTNTSLWSQKYLSDSHMLSLPSVEQ